MLERIQKWLALRSYRTQLSHLLVRRYGREHHYTPPQVLTTIREHGLSERYAAYACAMFCSKRAYDGFVAIGVAAAAISVPPATESSLPLWAGMAIQGWPEHHQVTAELQESHGVSHSLDFGSDYSDHSSGYFGDGHSHGDGHAHHGGGHDGGGHDGGGHGGSH